MDAAAIRDGDLQKKFHRPPNDLARAVGISAARGTALRAHLGIDSDEACWHVFVFGSQRHVRYSNNAYTRMRDAVRTLDMNAVWAAHGPVRKARPACTQPGCAKHQQLIP